MADKKILGKTESDPTSLQIRYAPTSETNVFYPESDGKPMAETERHRDPLINTLLTFQRYPSAPLRGFMHADSDYVPILPAADGSVFLRPSV